MKSFTDFLSPHHQYIKLKKLSMRKLKFKLLYGLLECFYSFEFNFVFVFPRTTNFQFSRGFFFLNDQFFQILCRFNFLVTKHWITSRDVLHEKSLHVVLLRFTIWREKLWKLLISLLSAFSHPLSFFRHFFLIFRTD